MPVPPPWKPEGGEPAGALPETPFWFTATRPAVLLGPDAHEPIGRLGTDGEYKAVAVGGPWVLVEDHFGRRGWVPDSVIPKRVRRQSGAGPAKKTGGLVRALQDGIHRSRTTRRSVREAPAEPSRTRRVSEPGAPSPGGGVVYVGLGPGVRGIGERGGPPSRRTWHVSEPGVTLVDSPGGVGVVAQPVPGTSVVEVERRDGHVKVTTPDGRTGWVWSGFLLDPDSPPTHPGLAAPSGGRNLRQRRVVKSGGQLREEPGGAALGWLAPGTVVTEQEHQDDVVRVVTRRGTTGWLRAQELEPDA